MFESLGNRMKAYEASSSYKLTPRSCVVIRVDGKAFHTYTRNFEKPYDQVLRYAMIQAMDYTSRIMQGFKLAYHQSDEATFLLTDFDNHHTEGWFGYKLSKIISVTASAFTAAFNSVIAYELGQREHALFDCRAFIVPKEDVPNVFVWRQKDWERNSVTMLAQAHFSHKQLHGKSKSDMHEMLHTIDINWADRKDWEKNGTFLTKDGSWVSTPLSYYEIYDLVFGGEKNA